MSELEAGIRELGRLLEEELWEDAFEEAERLMVNCRAVIVLQDRGGRSAGEKYGVMAGLLENMVEELGKELGKTSIWIGRSVDPDRGLLHLDEGADIADQGRRRKRLEHDLQEKRSVMELYEELQTVVDDESSG